MGIFDSGDAERIEAASLLIRYFADGQGTAAAVRATGCFPVRATANGTSLSDLWAGNDNMTSYETLVDYIGSYDQLTPGWATARTEWWNMLQRIGDGCDVAIESATLVANANAAARE